MYVCVEYQSRPRQRFVKTRVNGEKFYPYHYDEGSSRVFTSVMSASSQTLTVRAECAPKVHTVRGNKTATAGVIGG